LEARGDKNMPASMIPMNINLDSLTPNYILTVKITKQFWIRTALAKICIRLAAFILRCGVEIKEGKRCPE
jgi:hypothetical protein